MTQNLIEDVREASGLEPLEETVKGYRVPSPQERYAQLNAPRGVDQAPRAGRKKRRFGVMVRVHKPGVWSVYQVTVVGSKHRRKAKGEVLLGRVKKPGPDDTTRDGWEAFYKEIAKPFMKKRNTPYWGDVVLEAIHEGILDKEEKDDKASHAAFMSELDKRLKTFGRTFRGTVGGNIPTISVDGVDDFGAIKKKIGRWLMSMDYKLTEHKVAPKGSWSRRSRDTYRLGGTSGPYVSMSHSEPHKSLTVTVDTRNRVRPKKEKAKAEPKKKPAHTFGRTGQGALFSMEALREAIRQEAGLPPLGLEEAMRTIPKQGDRVRYRGSDILINGWLPGNKIRFQHVATGKSETMLINKFMTGL
jgi:hypothetical protein